MNITDRVFHAVTISVVMLLSSSLSLAQASESPKVKTALDELLVADHDPVDKLKIISGLPHNEVAAYFRALDAKSDEPMLFIQYVSLLLSGTADDLPRIKAVLSKLEMVNQSYAGASVYLNLINARKGDEEATDKLAGAAGFGPNMLRFVDTSYAKACLRGIAESADTPFGQRVEAIDILASTGDEAYRDVVTSEEFFEAWSDSGTETGYGDWLARMTGDKRFKEAKTVLQVRDIVGNRGSADSPGAGAFGQ